MPKQVSDHFNSFVSHLNNLEKTRKRMESLLLKRIVVRRDIEQVYEGLYMSSITSFENWIEDLFIGLLVGRLKHCSAAVVPRVSFKSDHVAREVIFSDRNYVDWLPYRFTQKRANAFFRNGMPFTCLNKPENKPDLKKLQILFYIRNVVAHKSAYSKKKFEDEVIGSSPVPLQEHTPAGYLRGIFRITPTQTRYENFINEMASIAKKLCS